MTKFGIGLAALAMAVLASACATKEDTGTLVGAGTGALIGNQFGSGPGRVAATLGGAVIGGFIGNRIGKSLDDEDRRRWQEAQYAAFENGYRTDWRNPNTGRYGYVEPQPIYTYEGYRCRNYTQTIFIDGHPQTMTGRACRQPDGTWREV